MILSVPPGAALDASARLLAEKLKASLDRPVVVDYKVGGAGLAAGEYLKSGEADGTNLLYSPTGFYSYNPFLFSKLPYDPDKELVPVCEGVTIPLAMTVPASSSIASFKDWIEAIRRDPKMRFVGSPSASGVGVFLTHLMAKTFGVELQVVAYKGGRPLLTDLLGGQVPASASVLADYLEMHRAGRLRILAQSSAGRSALAPELPSYTELGYPEFVGKTSFGFFVKAGTPRPLIDQYAKAITEALRATDTARRLNEIGLEVAGGTPDEFQKVLLDDRARWAPIARQAGIRLD
ncbi:MAG TPA: tripartite tricarboxylate transporter substrate-binding protein [Burkholderiales bacterium]|nr:tripartite tricarboxylate transporter substrate-binding protein [Burkholderiales bacterium]